MTSKKENASPDCSSILCNGYKGHGENEDSLDLVTPFAQVLKKLRHVKSNFVELTEYPNAHSEQRKHSSAISSREKRKNSRDTEVGPLLEHQKMVAETVDELEWCLDQLEAIQTHRSVSDMASSKFKRMLNKRLGSMGGHARSGNQISEYILTTYVDQKDCESNGSGGSSRDVDTAEDGDGGGLLMEDDSADAADGGADTLHGAVCSRQQRPPMSRISGVRPLRASSSFIGSVTAAKYGVDAAEPDRLTDLMDGSVDTWGMNMFRLHEITNHRPLTCVTFTIFRKRELFSKFHIHSTVFLNYLVHLEAHYRSDVSYHNSVHAADVTQSTHVLLGADAMNGIFSELEILAALFSSAVHDVDHPGVTNQFLVNTANELAIMYNDESVLENHHCAVAFKLLEEENCDFLEHLSKKQRLQLRRMVIDMVLATDMSKHMSLLASLKTMVESKKITGFGELRLDNYTDRKMILQNMVHCADLSNPAKPIEIYVQWTDRIMEEFFNQGDQEKQLGLEVSPMCDRQTASVPSSQVSFIDFIVHPLFETWCELIHPDGKKIIDTLLENRAHYSKLASPGCSGPPSDDQSDTEIHADH